jgi:hypothetical protein
MDPQASQPVEILHRLLADPNTAPVARLLDEYIASDIDPLPMLPAAVPSPYEWEKFGSALGRTFPWSPFELKVARFALLVALKHAGRPNSQTSNPLLKGMASSLNYLEDSDKPNASGLLVDLADEMQVPREQLAGNLLCYTIYSSKWKPVLGHDGTPAWPNAICRAIWRCPDQAIPDMIDDQPTIPGGFLRALAPFRPQAIRLWLERLEARGTLHDLPAWHWGIILSGTRVADDLCLSTLGNLRPQDQLGELLVVLRKERPGAYVAEIDAAIQTPQRAASPAVMDWLVAHLPSKALSLMSQAIAGGLCDPYLKPGGNLYRGVFKHAAGHLDEGNSLLEQALQTRNGMLVIDCVWAMRDMLTAGNAAILLPRIHNGLAVKMDSGLLAQFWTMRENCTVDLLWNELVDALSTKAKGVREALAETIIHCRPDQCVPLAAQLLQESKPERRLAAVMLLAMGEAEQTTPMLVAHLATESHDAVREEIHKRLKERGTQIHPDSAQARPEVPASNKPPKLPKTSWLKESELPALMGTDGTELPAEFTLRLIEVQSKHKSLDAAPDILPLLAHIDRGKSAPFAMALVEGFLNSEQAAADRWALALGGLLGDNRIIPPLLSRINDWCENSRHKLAEYAAQAISLLPGNEPLMVLDTLSNRYRSKFKNVGKACAEAFNAAAAARGITADELGDLVVPDFGFDADGIRRFDWSGGGASAELGADFKLAWFDPETEKSWKSLPSSAPDEIKNEVKTLTKLLREAVKGQTARLEMTLVRQRRWAVSRWRELYENHPLLRSFASSLVWGVYDDSGTLLRTFRRYPNGLLADAAGALEELPESDTMIGMVHPLELDAAALDAWRAHLARFKVKQPFPQIDRPLELLDPLHGNRREISLTNGKKLSAGTFKSRAEKRGWVRGSVVDAGGISSYYKLYPGAGVEVILPTDDFWIGCDPMDTLELRSAYFAKAGSVERGSYVYNEPAPDDPRVLRFDQVPTVVYSETLSDLKAIIATKE